MSNRLVKPERLAPRARSRVPVKAHAERIAALANCRVGLSVGHADNFSPLLLTD